jgi:hypothetical protein
MSDHKDVIHAAIMGLMGAILRSLYWLHVQINKGSLRPRFMATFMVSPFIGCLLGGASYLIVEVSEKVASSTNSTANTLTVGLFASFAGYNWHWALEKFLIAAEAIAGKGPQKVPAASGANPGGSKAPAPAKATPHSGDA